MRLADFAEHDVSLSGKWTDYHGQRRFIGRLDNAAPLRLASFVASGKGFWYAKSGRLYTETFGVDLLLHPTYGGESIQVILTTGSVINSRARMKTSRRIEIPDRFEFKTGHLVDWAPPDAVGPTIRLLAIAAEDLKTRRCGIWGVKPKYLPAVPEPWRPMLTKTRHGRIIV